MKGEFDAILKVLAGNRITLPKEYCNKTNIKKGDSVGVIQEKDGSLKIVPIDITVQITPRIKYK